MLAVVLLMLAGILMSLITGRLMYRLAPAAGYDTPEEREFYRGFGREWGWLTPIPVLVVWIAEVWRQNTAAPLPWAGVPEDTAAPRPALGQSREHTVEQAAVDNNGLAPLGARLAATIIDGVLITIPYAIFYCGVISMSLTGKGSIGTFVVLGIAGIAVMLLYAPLCMLRTGARRGQTFGKQMLGIRVVDASGNPASNGQIFRRELVGRSIPGAITLGVYSLVDAAWCLPDDHKRTLHDKIAGTVVVSVK